MRKWRRSVIQPDADDASCMRPPLSAKQYQTQSEAGTQNNHGYELLAQHRVVRGLRDIPEIGVAHLAPDPRDGGD